MVLTSTDLRSRREALVREHMETENRLDFEATLATFAHPRYELVATGEVYDGAEAVRGYYAASRAAFPDARRGPHGRSRCSALCSQESAGALRAAAGGAGREWSAISRVARVTVMMVRHVGHLGFI